MKRFYLFFFLIICPICVFAIAQIPTTNLQNKLNSFRSMTANFKQIVRDNNDGILETSLGTMALQRPGKFRWETKKPLKHLIVTNGKKVWIYEPDLQQATERNLDVSIGQTPILLLTSSKVQLAKNFFVTQLPTKGSEQVFQLIPKDQNAAFNKIILSFKNNKINQMVLYNNLGQHSVLIFTNIKINPAHLGSFDFIVPKGVDVVRE